MTFNLLHRRAWPGVAFGLAAVVTQTHALDVTLVGRVGSKAIVTVEGGAPRVLAPGASTREGVRLVSLDGDRAVVEANGRRMVLEMGAQPIQVDQRQGRSVTLHADSRGHFTGQARINGIPVRYLVDTGATLVSLGAGDAVRAGIDYRKGVRDTVQTAAGAVGVWRVTLDRVELGELTLHVVDAVVFEHELPVALLGMSVLNRVEMQRLGRRLILQERS